MIFYATIALFLYNILNLLTHHMPFFLAHPIYVHLSVLVIAIPGSGIEGISELQGVTMTCQNTNQSTVHNAHQRVGL